MDLFTWLLLTYMWGIAIMIVIAVSLHVRRCRGKLFRALLIGAAAGVFVPLVIFFSYPYLFPPPIDPPPHPLDQNAPLLPQFFASMKQDLLPAIARQVGYDISRIVDPFYYGVLAILIAFLASFLIPGPRRTGSTEKVFR